MIIVGMSENKKQELIKFGKKRLKWQNTSEGNKLKIGFNNSFKASKKVKLCMQNII